MDRNRVQVMRVHCPNCGDRRCEKIDILDRSLRRIQCDRCDYLLITCTETYRVIEAYAPGIAAKHV
jgi:ribosomal protein S27E